VLFYLGAMGFLTRGVDWGVYGGLFLVISLILTLGRRVVPFFIEKGVDNPVKLKNSKWIDLSSLVFFLSFTIIEVFFTMPALSAILALILFAINARRLTGWYTPGIWQKSLLWSLYLSFWFLCIGFALFATAYFPGINKYLAIHAFAVGGIGAMTLAMMARVALGHSGRSIQKPPRIMSYAFGLLLIGAVFRVFLPLIDAGHYTLWIALSQVLWIIAFTIFSLVYLPILSKPRIDGRPG
ncbi:MAG: NnrS family protein, partial [Proteobacteria bacterium]|nr:NnrS family protein [Pseudomonadota bacterium]